MKIPRLHRWPTAPAAALALQRALAPRVRLLPVPADVYLFAGTDVAFSPDGEQVVAGVVLWDARTRSVVEQRVARARCRLAYIPGLLSFRELPGLLAALRKLKATPQVVLCDGQGLAHPRRLGLACHLGLWLERPTLGCAKSRLCGDYDEPGRRKGDRSVLRHGGERVGIVVRTRDNVKPLFVSPGHLCNHDSAARLTLATTTRYRLPEPSRLAHQLVTRARSI
jgi:deoxyribonuclease V